MKALLIAGTTSGVGKTTVTLALIATLQRRGLIVQPYKGGPDFLLSRDANIAIPERHLDALYLGGGYPELHAAQLSGNLCMLQSIQSFAAADRPIYAECGGMIYLSQQLTSAHGSTHDMAGVLPFSVKRTSKLEFGYVTVELTRDCLLGECGTVVQGHSFHHSRIIHPPCVPSRYNVTYSLSGKREDEGFSIGDVLASYIHLHFRPTPGIARHFVEFAKSCKRIFGTVRGPEAS